MPTALLHDPVTYETGVPYAVLADLRREHGIVRVEEPHLPGWPQGPGYWLVLRHSDVRTVLGDPATFSSALGGTQIRDPEREEDLRYVRAMMLNMDPPEHTRLRRLLHASFTPRAVRALEDRVRDHARAIVDRMLAGPEEVDFAKEVAADLPLLVLADLLGMPSEDRWLMFDWANRVIGWQDPDYAVSASFDSTSGSPFAREALALRPPPGPNGRMPDPRSRDGMPDLYRYAHLLGAAKREAPGEDIMSILMGSRDDGGGVVTLEEFENLFWLFAVAGNETLRNGIPGGMAALLAHPEAQRALREDPRRIPAAVEEMLRWWTPVMTFRRTATRSTTLAGQAISPGDKVVVSFAAANRDESVYPSPDTFDIDRYAVRPPPRAHLAFGHGPHVCLGANLARVQMTAIFTEVLSRTSWIEAAGEPALLRSNFQRGVKRLPIRWAA
ncbi:MAG: cytochrome P450 [Actinobacteria bacterium]|nr:cytochrome P450 [Actinomycetota bacterium]